MDTNNGIVNLDGIGRRSRYGSAATYPDMTNGTTITTSGADGRTVPAGVTSIDIELWGAGRTASPPIPGQASDGGAGGGCASYDNLSVTPGDVILFNIGAASGGNSTTTSPSMTANGGGVFGTGGTATGGTTNNSGSNAGTASGTTGGTGGNAGAGINVSGGAGGAGGLTLNPGSAGTAPGGGGGGQGSVGGTNGAGANGGIRFSW